ncbi:tetratricopeptide repeat protein [Anderseniella sp. Alg231-50]|uniref:tetratricopeptide repeat protein n=1 Tax=Anderseniella sp. Alg231-50 TaxID=1922226 RepID=UPI00307B9AB2
MGWAGLAAGPELHGLKPAGSVVEVAVTNSTEPEPSLADDLRTSAEHVLRGNYHMDNGNYNAALAEYTRALEYDPKSWVAFLLRAYLYQLQGKNALAIKDLDKTIEFNPTVEAHVMRGVAYAFSGDDDAALKDYVTAVHMDPAYGSTYKQRAYIYLRRGRFAEAEADIQEAMRLLPDDLEVQHSFGDVLYYGGKIQAAKRQWEKTCAIADVEMTSDWQQRLAAIGRYKGPVDGQCDSELIEVFSACARDKCQF